MGTRQLALLVEPLLAWKANPFLLIPLHLLFSPRITPHIT
jgi:hypothetical protein